MDEVYFGFYFCQCLFILSFSLQDNSRNEWVFKKAIAIETYRNYHPIPVPWNIFSIPAVWTYNLCKGKVEETSHLDRLEQVSRFLMVSILYRYNLI